MCKYDVEKIRAVQKVDLEISKFFVDFCQKNDLLCYFCGGGCLGAVRHKGFIPWDDDLDFYMPRDDFERLKLIWKDTDQYFLRFPTEDYNDHNIFATLRDSRTTMIKTYQQDIDTVHGICIDIFPIDGYPNKKFQRIMQVFWGFIYQLFCAQLIPDNHGKVARLFAKGLLGLIRNKKNRYRIWKNAEKHMSKYTISECDSITDICSGPRTMMKFRFPKEIFASAVFLEFEDTKMPVPVGYVQYLRIVFGDYMQLPPEEERVPQHDALIIDANKPYLYYYSNIVGK